MYTIAGPALQLSRDVELSRSKKNQLLKLIEYIVGS